MAAIGEDLERLKQRDYVLHQAAIPQLPTSLADPVGSNRANVGGDREPAHSRAGCQREARDLCRLLVGVREPVHSAQARADDA